MFKSIRNRTRTISTGSDALEQSSVPYDSTSQPAAVPRHSISDGPAANDQRSRASDVSMVSPTLRQHPPTMNLIPEHMPDNSDRQYADSSLISRDSQHRSTSRKYSATPEPSMNSQQRRRPSTSTEGDTSYHSVSAHTSNGSSRPPHRHMERLVRPPPDEGSSVATTGSVHSGHEGAKRANSRSSNYGRHKEPPEERRGSSSQHGRDRTTSTQSRNDPMIPPYSPTMRSIGNSSSQFAPYPYGPSTTTANTSSQQASMRASQASTHSVKSHRSSVSLNSSRMAPPTPPLTSSEFVFPRPSSDEDIESLFEDLLQRTDVPIRDRDGMRQWPVTKKWTMIFNDKLQDWKQTRKSVHIDRTTPQMPTAPTMGATPSAEQNAVFAGSAPDPNNKMRLQRGKTESPEWYLTKFMDGSIQPAIVSSLTVGLRTYEISWVETFVNKLHGLSVLTNALANISKLPVPRKEHDLKLELEIVKCLKHLLQMQVSNACAFISWAGSDCSSD